MDRVGTEEQEPNVRRFFGTRLGEHAISAVDLDAEAIAHARVLRLAVRRRRRSCSMGEAATARAPRYPRQEQGERCGVEAAKSSRAGPGRLVDAARHPAPAIL